MDLSAIIFVLLALAWAVYLIPKALKHHDEMASDRLLEGHSDRVRILARKARTTAAVDEAEAVTPNAPESAPVPQRVAPDAEARETRTTAGTAAQRRRRVLGVLVVALVIVWTLTWFAYLPIWAPAVPGALVVAWLVIARLSVRTQQRARRTRPAVESFEISTDPTDPTGSSVEEDRPTRLEPASSNADEFLDQLADEDTTGHAREQLEAALSDEGSLWDPLPMTLPTYVNKARARRTVRTIELTGINSSGHDETDTALAREAAETVEPASETGSGQRKVAGA